MDISAYQHMNIRMSTRGKRPLRNLTPSDKVRAIQRIHNGETKASVSRDIGVPESTLRGWCKNEQKLRFMCRQLGMDQMPMDALENPPEKRTKIENQIAVPRFSNITTSYDDFGYNRLPLNGVDFTATNNIINNNNTNAILENIALSEFMKKNNFPTADGIKQYSGSGHLSGLAALPVTTDYSQQSMIQNLNLLSLLNPSLATMSSSLSSSSSSGVTFSAGSCLLDNDNSSKAKLPLRTSNSVDETRDSVKNTSSILSVKNWAKDTSENMSTQNGNSGSCNKNTNTNKLNLNDTNNNDIESNLLLAPITCSDSGAFSLSLLPTGLTGLEQVPPAGTDSGSSQVVLLDWCKVFNASLNFLALAAAAAALQTPTTQSALKSTDENYAKPEQVENILFKQLTKDPHTLNSSKNSSYMHSDVSNDSYFFDSEPEDLSVRSTTSKLSSPSNSRSQSPAKSNASTFSTHSETEQ